MTTCAEPSTWPAGASRTLDVAELDGLAVGRAGARARDPSPRRACMMARVSAVAMTVPVFVNTRSQAESIFQELWGINDDGLAIALHHGSLDVAQRRKVEAAMAVGRLRAVVATSSLDLGIDWGDVDLVINVGAPKGASRLLQRIGRANHRMDEPSNGVLIPANRFEVLECTAALGAIAENAQDTPAARIGALEVLTSIFSVPPAARRSWPTSFSPKSPAPRPMRRSPAPISTPCSISSRPADTR